MIYRHFRPQNRSIFNIHEDSRTKITHKSTIIITLLTVPITWAKAGPINLKPKAGEAFGFGYHDPREVNPEEFRFDLALSVPQDFKLNDQVTERTLPAGRYAITMHKGSRDNIGDTIYSIYRDWLPQSGEELGDLPCIFCYYNFDYEVAETESLTEIWVLLK